MWFQSAFRPGGRNDTGLEFTLCLNGFEVVFRETVALARAIHVLCCQRTIEKCLWLELFCKPANPAESSRHLWFAQCVA